jgi:hypothetical protein
MVHILSGLKRPGGAEQQARSNHTHPYHVSYDYRMRNLPPLSRSLATINLDRVFSCSYSILVLEERSLMSELVRQHVP